MTKFKSTWGTLIFQSKEKSFYNALLDVCKVKGLEEVYISGKTLLSEHFNGVNLSQGHFRGCTFRNVNFYKCDFHKTFFDSCKFIDCRFDSCIFIEAIFDGCTFNASGAYYSDFSYATLAWNNFKDSGLGASCTAYKVEIRGNRRELCPLHIDHFIHISSMIHTVFLVPGLIKIGCQMHSPKTWKEFLTNRKCVDMTIAAVESRKELNKRKALLRNILDIYNLTIKEQESIHKKAYLANCKEYKIKGRDE